LINEQDIFYYVFFRHSISLDKINEIENENSFGEAINFYEQLKNNLSEIPDYSLKRKIAEKINAYSLQRIYYLFPDNFIPSVQRKKSNVLAAASSVEGAKVTSKTFTDGGNNFLIRAVSTAGITKMYIFSFTQSMVKNFTLILLPSMEKYHIKDNSQPLVLDKPIEFDSISIEFVLEEEKVEE